MREYYAARAAEYDDVYLKPERQDDLRAIARWLPGVVANRRVLEVACGTGFWTRHIARRASRVVAVDVSPEMLAIARERVYETNVRLLIGDAYDLPELGERFETGVAGFWFSHVPIGCRRTFLRGFHAALAVGARVVMMDNRFVDGSSSPISERDEAGNTYQMRTLNDGTSYRVLKNFPTEKELRATVAGLGSTMRYSEWEYYWALEYVVAEC